jgi:hypothetical protein
MIIIKRGSIVYYIKDEAVIVGINDMQYIAYTIYPLQNRKPFYDFRRTLIKSEKDEFLSATDLVLLGQKYGLRAVSAVKPTEAYDKE